MMWERMAPSSLASFLHALAPQSSVPYQSATTPKGEGYGVVFLEPNNRSAFLSPGHRIASLRRAAAAAIELTPHL
jgi:hypothetical protein